MMLLGKAEGVITLDISDLTAKAGAANAALGTIGTTGQSGFGKLESQLNSVGMSTDRLGMGFMALGATLLAPMTIGLKGAIDFEQQMKNVNVSLGDVSKADFSRLTQQITDIGANGQYSAGEIAIVADELAKAGYSIEDIMSGDPAAGFGNMAQSVSDLASATGDGLLPATQAITTAMATYSPEVVKAGKSVNGFEMQVLDASRVADVFTVAANASRASTEDLNAGFRNFGSTAASMNIPIEESVGAIALFTNYGIKATDAGTSMTRAMVNLANPTEKSAKLMDELGIAAFDASGQFIGMPQLFDQVQKATAGMSEEARTAALSTIFGAEALDVMTIAAMTGGDPLRQMTGDMTDYGIAARQAADRVDTLKGALERMTEGISTALMLLASGLTPVLRIVADGIDTIVSAFLKLPGPVISAIGLVITSIGLLFTATGAFLLMGPRVAQFMQTARLMSQLPGILGGGATAFLRLASAIRIFLLAATGIGAIIGVIAALVKLDLWGFGDAWERASDAFHQAAGTGNVLVGIINAISAALKSFDLAPLNAMAAVLDQIGTGVLAFWAGFSKAPTGGITTNMTMTGDDKVIEWVENPDAIDGTGIDFMVRVKNPDGSLGEFGQIMESNTDENDPNIKHIKIKTDDGEYWTTVDMTTGVIGEGTIEVAAEDAPGNRSVPSMMDRIANGFVHLRNVGQTMNIPFLENIGQWGLNGVNAVSGFTNAWSALRERGVNPVSAALQAASVAFNAMGWDTAAAWATKLGVAIGEIPFGDMVDSAKDFIADGLEAIQPAAKSAWNAITKGASGAWNAIQKGGGYVNRLTDNFRMFRQLGANPVEAAMRSLGVVFPGLSGPINRIISGAQQLRSAFSSLMDLDFGGFWDGLTGAFDGVGDAIMGALSGVSEGLGNWLADLFGGDGGDGVSGGVMGDGLFGRTMTEDMRERLEKSAKSAWERAWDNFKSWVRGQAIDLGGWILNTGIPTLAGWIATAAGNVWEAIKALAGWSWDGIVNLGDITVQIGRWVMGNIVEPVWDWFKRQVVGEGPGAGVGPMGGTAEREISLGDVLVKIGSYIKGWAQDAWAWAKQQIMGGSEGPLGGAARQLGGREITLGDITVRIGQLIKGWTIDVGEWLRTQLMGWTGGKAAGKAALGGREMNLGDVTLTLGKLAWESDLMDKIDRAWEDAVGKTIVQTVNVTIDAAITFQGDPGGTARKLLLGLLAISLVGLALTAGVGPLLALVGLPLLAYAIVQGAMDYFERNPIELEKLKIRISEFWADLKAGQFGGILQAIEDLFMALVDVATAGWDFIQWLRDLPGPIGTAIDALGKLAAALTALFFIAGIGGMGGKKPGGGGKVGFFGGLMRGLWEIIKFPYTMLRHPVQAIKQILDLGGLGAKGGKRVKLTFMDTLNGMLRFPFRMISKGIEAVGHTLGAFSRSIKNVRLGWRAFAKGYDRGVRQLTSLSKTLARAGVQPLSWLDIRIGALARGLQGLWQTMSQSKGPMGTLLRSFGNMARFLDPVANAIRRAGRWIVTSGLDNLFGGGAMGKTIGDGIRQAFRLATVGMPGMIRGAFSQAFGRVSLPGNPFARLFSGLGPKLLSAFDNLMAPAARGAQSRLFGLGFLLFGNLGPNIAAAFRGAIASASGPIVRATSELGTSILRSVARIFGADAAVTLMNAADRFKNVLRNIFTPKGMGIIADPKAFAAFNAIGDMVDNVASRVGKFKSFGKVFSGLGDDIMRMVRPLGNVGGALGNVFRFATRLSPALRAIGAAFAFFGIEKGVAKLWDAIGGLDGIKNAWDTLTEAFEQGGWSAVFGQIGAFISDMVDNIMDALSDISLGDIWDFITESAANIDWVTVAGLIVMGLTLMVAGIPGLLLGIAASLLWSWIDDSLREYDWGSLGSDWGGVFQSAISALATAGSWILDRIRDGVELAGELANWFIQQLMAVDWQGLFESAITTLSAAGTWILGKIRDGMGLAGEIANWFLQQLMGVDWMGLFQSAITTLAAVGSWIIGKFGEGEALASQIGLWFMTQMGQVPWQDLAMSAFTGLSAVATWIMAKIGEGVKLGSEIGLWFMKEVMDADWQTNFTSAITVLKDVGLWIILAMSELDVSRRIGNWFYQQLADVDWRGKFDLAINALQNVGDWILEKIGLDTLTDAGTKIIEALGDGFEAGWEAVRGILEGIIEDLKNMWNAFAAEFNAWAAMVPGGKFDIKLPMFTTAKTEAQAAKQAVLELRKVMTDFRKDNDRVETVPGEWPTDAPGNILNTPQNRPSGGQAVIEDVKRSSIDAKAALLDLRKVMTDFRRENDRAETPTGEMKLPTPVIGGAGAGLEVPQFTGIDGVLTQIRQMTTQAKTAMHTGLAAVLVQAIQPQTTQWGSVFAQQLNTIPTTTIPTTFARIGPAVSTPLTTMGTTTIPTALSPALTAFTNAGTAWGTSLGTAVNALPPIANTGFGGVTTAVGTSTAAQYTTAATRWGGMLGSAVTNFSGMYATGASNSNAMQGAVTGAVGTMTGSVSNYTAAMQGAANAQAALMNTGVSTQASTMRSQVGSSTTAMQLGVAMNMLTMKNSAISAAQQMGSGTQMAISLSMLAIVGTVRNSMNSIPGIIASAGASAAATAYNVGAMIGIGLAAGMRSALGSVQAAASELINTVNAAMAKAALLGSPSKITIQFGEWIGEGLAIGMSRTYDQVASAAAKLAEGTRPEVGSLIKYLGAIIGDGDYLNDWLTHLPIQMREVTKEFGRMWAPLLEGMDLTKLTPNTRMGVSASIPQNTSRANTGTPMTSTTYNYTVAQGAIVVNESETPEATAEAVFAKLGTGWDTTEEIG